MPFQVATITINPLTTKYYTHQSSLTELVITIAGEDLLIGFTRPRSILPSGLPDPKSPAALEAKVFPFANDIEIIKEK